MNHISTFQLRYGPVFGLARDLVCGVSGLVVCSSRLDLGVSGFIAGIPTFRVRGIE